MKRDPLGDRMKGYEAVSRLQLMRRTPVIVRVDGRAFHTYTRGLKRPFDGQLAADFEFAAARVAAGIQGFKLAYHQSDEVSFLFHDFDRLTTDAWFGNDLQKIVSITASEFTRAFNEERLGMGVPKVGKPVSDVATFDCRAFSVPKEEVTNYFLWRARDWHRNSLFMFASQFFSASQLHEKGREQIHEMLYSVGKNWATDVSETFRNGTFISRRIHVSADPDEVSYLLCPSILPKYEEINALVEPLLQPLPEATP